MFRITVVLYIGALVEAKGNVLPKSIDEVCRRIH